MFNLGKKIRIETYTSRGTKCDIREGILTNVTPHYITVKFENYKECFNKGDIVVKFSKTFKHGDTFKFIQKLKDDWKDIIVPEEIQNLRELIR